MQNSLGNTATEKMDTWTPAPTGTKRKNKNNQKNDSSPEKPLAKRKDTPTVTDVMILEAANTFKFSIPIHTTMPTKVKNLWITTKEQLTLIRRCADVNKVTLVKEDSIIYFCELGFVVMNKPVVAPAKLQPGPPNRK